MRDETTREAFDFETWRRGRVLYTADWHLEHARIIDLCERPFSSLDEMNETILRNTNAVATWRDTLVILGDLLLGKFEVSVELLRQIHCKRIWLIPGNHDRWSLAYGHRGSAGARATRRMLFAAEYAARRADGIIRVETDRVPSAWPVLLGGRQVLLSHYPYVGDSRHGEDRHRDLRPRWAGQPLVHGHVHGLWRENGPMFNVGVDVNGFTPVGESVLADWAMGVPMDTGAGERVH
jgi:calcineurin-like phosphoesterase family protein